MRDYEAEEVLRRAKREQRRARLREQQRRRQRRKQILFFCCTAACALFLLAAGLKLAAGSRQAEEILSDRDETKEKETALAETMDTDSAEEPTEEEEPDPDHDMENISDEERTFVSDYQAEATDATVPVDEEAVRSAHAVLIDLDNRTIVAQKGEYDRISPASMTKILTVLVAAEHIVDLEDTFTITREITDYSYRNDCSAAGFADGETVTVRDLLYGTILPSGADAAAGLAYYVSGSLEGFADLMNEKLYELGLSETAHFTNCVGLYDEQHYCSIYDMAMILKAAVENDLCREVLSAHTYVTSVTEEHPEGITLSNWFLRRIEDKETNGEVVCAKTGFVAQSGSCAASYGISESGRHYICVTADTYSSWRCIYDHVAMYQKYTE